LSETTPTDPTAPAAPAADGSASAFYPVRLAYAVFGALQADMGCLIGAIAFVILIALSVVFAAQLTPCTSAGGIPCSP